MITKGKSQIECRLLSDGKTEINLEEQQKEECDLYEESFKLRMHERI
jgi:hypothetical protein